ncbi:MAG: class I adenylate-forming enzyme family protein [Alphaproteobacteria bacterium]
MSDAVVRAATTIDAIARWARLRPTAPAFIAGDAVLDFARLAREIDGMAAALQAAGVRPGAPTGLVLETTPRHFLVQLALFRLGAAVVPLSSAEPANERRAVLARAGARLSVCLAGQEIGGAPHVLLDRLTGPGVPASLPPPPGPDVVAYFARSSGTSRGVPKLVATTFGHAAAADARALRSYPIVPRDRHLMLAPLGAYFGRHHSRRALAAGAAVIFAPADRSAAAVRAAVLRHRATLSALTPPMLRDLLATAGEELVLPGVRVYTSTAPLTGVERHAVLARLTPYLHISYGTSEVGGISMAVPADLAVDIETLGRPLAGVEVEIVDDVHRPLPPGEVGTVRARSSEFPSAYVDEVPGASSRFRGGWFYPGDVGTIDDDGRIVLAGRVDDIINVGGKKVYPTDIERVIARHGAVREAAVVAVPDARHGQVPVAAVVLRGAADEASLVRFCADALPPRLRPRRVIAVAALPRNAAGKLDRRRLASMVGEPIAG